MQHVSSVEGVKLQGAINGAYCSSTRTEIAAAIFALSTNEAVHQATDSMAYKRKVDRLLNGENLQRKKPWALQNDGDLWQILSDLVASKGPNCIKVTWCKGHATDKHIADGTSTAYLKAGNDIVDKLAEAGVEFYDGLRCLSMFYVCKQATSLNLLKRIHAMFIRVLQEEHELRTKMESAKPQLERLVIGAKHEHITLAAAYKCPSWEEGLMLSVDPLSDASFQVGKHDHVIDIYNFIRTSKFKATTLGVNGTSWVELLARFLALGGTLSPKRPTSDHDDTALSLR